MIKSNSPYYITTPLVSPGSGLTCQNYQLSVWVWNGLKSALPATANYTTTKGNPTGATDSDTINIARIVNDYIEFTPQKASSTSVIDGNNQQWVKTSVIYNKEGTVSLPQITSLRVLTGNQVAGASCLLTLNGVEYSITLPNTTLSLNANTIKSFINNDPVVSLLYTATLNFLSATVTITANSPGLQSATTWLVGGATGMTVNILTIQAGSSGEEAPQNEATSLMSLGYSYGDEGLNNTIIANNTLIPVQDYKVNREGDFVVPVLISETATSLITVISYPDNEINFSVTEPATTTSFELVKYIWIQCSDTTTDRYIEVTSPGQVPDSPLQFDWATPNPYFSFYYTITGFESLLIYVTNRGATTNTTGYTDWSDIPASNFDVVLTIGGIQYAMTYTYNGIGIGSISIPHGSFNVNSKPIANTANFQLSVIDSDGIDNSALFQTFNAATDSILVNISTATTPPVITLLIQDELKYNPVDIFFQNKEGAEQVLTFFKEQKSGLSITSSEFESDRGQPSTGNHQFVRYNVQGRTDLTLNSGFVDEEMNEIFTQLLLSERIWSYNGTNFTPLNIKSKQISYKTQLNERLINYEIKFEYSYNEINNI